MLRVIAWGRDESCLGTCAVKPFEPKREMRRAGLSGSYAAALARAARGRSF